MGQLYLGFLSLALLFLGLILLHLLFSIELQVLELLTNLILQSILLAGQPSSTIFQANLHFVSISFLNLFLALQLQFSQSSLVFFIILFISQPLLSLHQVDPFFVNYFLFTKLFFNLLFFLTFFLPLLAALLLRFKLFLFPI